MWGLGGWGGAGYPDPEPSILHFDRIFMKIYMLSPKWPRSLPLNSRLRSLMYCRAFVAYLLGGKKPGVLDVHGCSPLPFACRVTERSFWSFRSSEGTGKSVFKARVHASDMPVLKSLLSKSVAQKTQGSRVSPTPPDLAEPDEEPFPARGLG